MANFLIYKGPEDKIRWRKETADGQFIEMGGLYATVEEAVAAVQQVASPEDTLDNRVQAQEVQQ